MSIPLLRPPVCSRSPPSIYFLRSIPASSPLHSPPPNYLLLFVPLSPILPLKSSPKSIQSSLFSFITSSCCLHLFTVYCHYFPPFIAYMNFSFHASFFFSLFFNPQFHPCYYSSGSSSLFLFSFCPWTFPFVLFR
jgi:hypothetical protein